MKKIIMPFLLAIAALPFIATAQNTDFQKGSILTASNEKAEGSIRDLTKNKGSIVFTSAGGEKKTYTPGDILGFSLNGADYISYAGDFYKVVTNGNKAALYQRATDNSGKMVYNGAEAVSVTTAEGRAGDLYIQLKGEDKFALITAKNFDKVLPVVFAGCAVVVADVKAKQIDYTQLSKAVEKYNACN